MSCKFPTDEELYDICADFKALGEINRLKITMLLLNGEKCVSDICEIIGLSQSATSHQLRILKDCKILKSRKEGNVIYYSIKDEHVKTIIEMSIEHLVC